MLLSTHPRRAIGNWLFFTAFMVFAMAVIGAVTRLTESGLSMVEWKPLIGAIPPLSMAEWDRVFGLYKQTPEFIHKNSWMELTDFQRIFFWEWLHRLWGRVIGLVFALPLAWFWIKGQIPQGYKGKFLGVLALGGLQGVMGWFMVMSGLVDRPDVSHYRLAAHLLLALVIFCVLLWLAFDIKALSPPGRGLGEGAAAQQAMTSPSPLPSPQGEREFCQKRHGWISFALLAVTITWGAFTAGLDGGMLYNTWPVMDSHWAPPEVFRHLGFLNEPGGVQFIHRWLAIAAFVAIMSFGWRFKNFPLILMAFLQVGLGIGTVLSQAAIPIAALHQAGAMVLLGLLVKQLHDLHAPSLRGA
ncbi:MAG TPA: COX15/CtaA family protein [Micavibrio sp.]|nr:COX15/CtaA family protein [Micavibrio sp.]